MGRGHQRRADRLKLLHGDGRARAQHTGRVVPRDVGHQHAEGGQHTGMARHTHPCHLQFVGDLARVHAAGATESHQRKLSGIMTALHRHHPNRALHVGVGHAYDPFGERRHSESGLFRQGSRHTFGACAVDGHAPTQKVVGVQPAEQQVGIGDRQFIADAVTDGPGCRTCTSRPHTQRAACIHVRNRATTRTHRVDVDHGQPHGKVTNTRIRGACNLLVNQAHVGGRATHVEADHTCKPRRGSHGLCAHNPSRRTRQHRAHRLCARGRRRNTPAVRLHDREASRAVALPLDASSGQPEPSRRLAEAGP